MSTDLEIRVTAELREIKAALASLRGDIATVGTAANASAAGGAKLAGTLQQSAIAGRAAAQAGTQVRTALAGAVTQAKLMLGALGVIGTGLALVRMADTATRLDGQLRLVTKTQAEFNRAQEETAAIAQRTRQGLEGTVNLYARIARAGRTSQEQTLQLTESINQAVALSFTSAEAGAAALFQLGQGLGSGVLRGEELNSVLEQTPRLAQAIAEGLVKLGKIKDPGGLRAYANANGIEAKLVVDAIITQQKRLRDEFAQLKPTVADAYTALKNAALQYVRDTNSQTGATNDLAAAIRGLAENFKLLADGLVTGAKLYGAYFLAFRAGPVVIAALASAFVATRAAIALATPAMTAAAAQAALITRGFAGATVQVNLFAGALTRAAVAGASMAMRLRAAFALVFALFAGFQIGEYLRKEFQSVELFGIALAAGLHKVAFLIGQGFQYAGATVKIAFTEAFNWVKTKGAEMLDGLASSFNALPGAMGAAVSALAKSTADAVRGAATKTESFSEAYKRLAAETAAGLAKIDLGYQELAENAVAARRGVEGATAKPAGNGGGAAGAIAKVVDTLALEKDAAERALDALQRLYDDGEISVRRFYTEKVRLQQAAIDADIAAAQRDAAAAKTADARKAALTQLVILERQRRDVAVVGAHDQGKAEDELIDKLGDVQIRLLELEGKTAQARKLELEAQYLDLFKRLGAESDEAGKAIVRKLINLEAAKAGLEQFKSEFQDVTGALSQLQQTTSAQVSAGLLSNATAEDRLAQARAHALDQLRAQRAEVAALYEQYKDPDTLQHLQALDQQIAELSVSTEDWRGKMQDASTSALSTFFKELTDGSHSASEAVRDLAVNFSQSMAQMAADALAKKAIGAIFDLFTQDQSKDPGTQVAAAAAAGLAYSTPVTTAAATLAAAGGVVVSGASALTIAAAALQAAATTLLVANSASVGIAHTGGVVGALSQFRSGVSPYAFTAAPRYHSGGIAGLRHDEVPAILQRGEEVITKGDPRHRRNGGLEADGPGARGGNQRFIFVDDQRRVADYLNSPDGEQATVHMIGRNAGAVREVLGLKP